MIFSDDNKFNLLYHYTTFGKGISIISSKILLFGRVEGLNDFNESQRTLFCECITDENIIEKSVKALAQYGQISFSCEDSSISGKQYRGFDLAPMWSHYADKGNGLCIVFNKEKILKQCRLQTDCQSSAIEYKVDFDNAVTFRTCNPEYEIRRMTQDIFFQKSIQWQHEQEYRIVKKRNHIVDFLDISDCIEGIIYMMLGAKSGESPNNTASYILLKRSVGKIPIYGYNPRSSNGFRDIYKDSDGKVIWSTGEIVDIESNEWQIVTK